MIDLHLHSRASDGSLTPTDLVQLCVTRGVVMLALTDHDCVGGLPEAMAAAASAGVHWVAGVEISVTWEHRTLHVVGLNFDPGHAALSAGLARLQTVRSDRAREIGRRLEIHGLAGAYTGARKIAAGDNLARTHFAAWLHSNGYASSQQKAFQRWLAHGKPGHVPGNWAQLEECIGWIHAAGGRAVLAHPLRYRMTHSWLMKALAAFKQAGGDGLEVICGGDNRDAWTRAAQLARHFKLCASAGSDFHNPATAWNLPGISTPLPSDLTPVWETF